MIRLSTLLLVVLISLSAFALHAAPTPRAIQEDAIREAAFRFVLHPYPLSSRAKPMKNEKKPPPIQVPKDYVDPFKVYFLSVGDKKDPSDKVFKRFAGHKPPIKKVSQSYIDSTSKDAKTTGYWVRDKKTKELGLIFTVADIKWLGKNTVTLWASRFAGGVMGSAATLTLRRKGKIWKVTHIKDPIAF